MIFADPVHRTAGAEPQVTLCGGQIPAVSSESNSELLGDLLITVCFFQLLQLRQLLPDCIEFGMPAAVVLENNIFHRSPEGAGVPTGENDCCLTADFIILYQIEVKILVPHFRFQFFARDVQHLNQYRNGLDRFDAQAVQSQLCDQFTGIGVPQ